MKRKFFFYSLTIAVLLLFINTACKKKETNDDTSNNNPPPVTTVTDIDGNVYNTIEIGTQIWMKENLKVTHYRNGDAIPNVTSDTEWTNLSSGAYCDYDNSPGNYATYGRLYNYYAIADLRNVCPEGWHIPVAAEWDTLSAYLGGNQWAGGKLKETDTIHWMSPNVGATNEVGFTALGGGYRHYLGLYNWQRAVGIWWTSSPFNATNINTRTIYHDNTTLTPGNFNKTNGFSIRCVKD